MSFSKATVEDTAAEETRLDAALAKSTEELQQIREKAAQSLGEAEAQVFDAHLMVFSDPEMVGQIKQNIKDNSVNAEAALKRSNGYVYRYVRSNGRQCLHARACCRYS